MHLIQWKRICRSNYIWIILVDESDKLYLPESDKLHLPAEIWYFYYIILVVCPRIISGVT